MVIIVELVNLNYYVVLAVVMLIISYELGKLFNVRLINKNMSGPLSDKSDGTTPNAQVTNNCLSAGERPNKNPIFISGARDTHAFLARLHASCPGGLTAQLKAEKLMVVPSTANGFIAAVSALRSIDG